MSTQKQAIPIEDQENIINFFRTEKNNTLSDIMKKFGYKKSTISDLLDKHLKSIKQCTQPTK